MQINPYMSLVLMMVVAKSRAMHQHCPQYRDIYPSCTCQMEFTKISVNCEKMSSFGEVVGLLAGRFQLKDRIKLRIARSKLPDLEQRSFRELNMTVIDLKLTNNDLSDLSPHTFAGLTHVAYLSLADNPIPYMPIQVFEMMPNVKTLDLGRLRLRNLPAQSFQSLQHLETLVLPGNMLNKMDPDAIPTTVTKLHLARNSIKELNGTLRHLTELNWFFIGNNELTNLEGELPKNNMKINMLHAAHNKIHKLPSEIKTYPNLDMLFFQHNLISSLDGILSKSRKLDRINLENNRIAFLTPDDFAETERLKMLELQFNLITSLNGSLLPLRRLEMVNLTHNLLTEFSWHEIRNLKELRALDLSFNKIRQLTGLTPNLIEWETKLTFLKLDHNELHNLDGGLSGLRSLLRLNLSFNSLTRISPDDLIGLDQLTMLDISHNNLTTLEETSKTFLPALEELIASHNSLTVLDKDFHGLPVLCWADLSHNQITSLGKDLVSKTHCKIQDGVHDDNWGTLQLYLQHNPILCDAALPEINSAMEINHTRIVGVSHCPPLSERTTPPPQLDFLGYASDSTSEVPLESVYKVDTNNVPENEFVPIDQQVPIRHNHGFPVKLLDTFKHHQHDEPAAVEKLTITELPLNDQPIYTNVDPVVQVQQISLLASEIEELRSRVEQLTSENKRLARNLHGIVPEEGVGNNRIGPTTDASYEGPLRAP